MGHNTCKFIRGVHETTYIIIYVVRRHTQVLSLCHYNSTITFSTPCLLFNHINYTTLHKL